jgi:hypothetical protein
MKPSKHVSAKIQYYLGPFQMSRNIQKLRNNIPQVSTLLTFVGFKIISLTGVQAVDKNLTNPADSES